MLRLLRILLLPAILLLAANNAVQAQTYFLDSSFAHTGIDTFRGFIQPGIIHRPVVVKQQLDGKILIAGYSTNSSKMELMRVLPDGRLDSTFNDSGMVRIVQSYTNDNVRDAALYDTGNVYVINGWLDITGGGNTLVKVYNVLKNGQLNPAFGSGGITNVDFSKYSIGLRCAAQSDHKLLIMGATQELATGYRIYALMRLKLNGTVDSTYGTNGRSFCPYPGLNVPATGVYAAQGQCGYMQSDDKYVIAGTYNDAQPYDHSFIVRHNSDGSPDMTFGEANGMTLIKADSQTHRAYGIGADTAGNYYVLISYEHPYPPYTDTNYAVMKLDHNGHRVMSYGVNGISKLQLAAVANIYSGAMAVQKDGRVIISNTYRTYAPFTDWYAAYGLDVNGHYDNNFAPGGHIYIQRPGAFHDICVNTAVQSDGKVLLVGYDSLQATSICIRLTNRSISTASTESVYKVSHPGYLFPNPSYNKGFYIHYPGSAKDKGCTIYAYDENGKLMDTRAANIPAGISDIEYQLPPSAAPGIYTIVLQDESGERQVYKAVSL